MDNLWIIWLVVKQTPLKNMNVHWDDELPSIWENEKCSKPPTSYRFKQLLRKCLGCNFLLFGGLSTFSDSVWVHMDAQDPEKSVVFGNVTSLT